MAPPGTIGNREREILTAIVETFIATGEPVGSRVLSRSNREGLSPATIRNVMADLSEAGFLEQTAHVLRSSTDDGSVPILRRTDQRRDASVSRRSEHHSRIVGWHHGCFRIS